jgi:hypothetical protein
LGVRYEDVRAQVLSGKTDAEVLDWCFANGRRLTEELPLVNRSTADYHSYRKAFFDCSLRFLMPQ